MLLDLLLGVIGNLAADELRPVIEGAKYKNALRRRVRELDRQAVNAYGDDGAALLAQAGKCVLTAALSQEQVIASALDAKRLFSQLQRKSCYTGLTRSMARTEKDSFDGLCNKVLQFICAEIPKLESAHREIAAEQLRRAVVLEAKVDTGFAGLDAKVDEMSSSIRAATSAQKVIAERDARQLISDVSTLTRVYDLAKASEVARQLEEWLGKLDHEPPTSLVAEAYESLANIETVGIKDAIRLRKPVSFGRVRSFLRSAVSACQGCADSVVDRLLSLEAYVTSLEQDADTGLALLEGKDDPYSVRRKLLILRDAQRLDEATNLVRGKRLDEVWCDQAAYVFAVNGEDDEVKRVLRWSRASADIVTRDRCLLALAEGLCVRSFRDRRAKEAITPGSLTPDEQSGLSQAIDILGSIVQTVEARGRVDTQLEACAVGIALKSHCLLEHGADCQSLGLLLSTRVPAPLDLAHLALFHELDVPDDFPDRLRRDHPGSFEAKLLAAKVESDLQNRHKAALNAALRLIDESDSPEDRVQLCGVLFEIGQRLGPEEQAEVDKAAPSLLKGQESFLRLLEAERLLRSGDVVQAKSTLNHCRDDSDSFWLQLYAGCLEGEGDHQGAIDNMLKAIAISPLTGLMHRTAAMAYHHGRLDDTAEVLRKYLSLKPADINARQNLAFVNMERADFRAAAYQYGELRKLKDDEPLFVLGEAECLALSGDYEAALRTLESGLAGKGLPLQLLLRRADVMKGLGQPHAAVDLLKNVRERYWESPEFLVNLLHLAYAAGEESLGHEAFVRLQQLQSEGKIPADVLRAASLDDILEQVKEHRERSDDIHRNMLQGRASWLMAEEFLGRAPYLGWWIRTQPLIWLGDDPSYRAEHTVYSTNAFATATDETGRTLLRPIQCAPPGNPVVIDLSALVTLHRLGLLHLAATYFGKIVVPAVYQRRILADGSRLVLHQLSQKTSLDDIKRAIDTGKISVLRDIDNKGESSLPRVHEHTMEDDKGQYYRIRDLLDALETGEKITQEDFREVDRVAHKQSGVDAQHRPLAVGQAIQVDLSTLKTLSQVRSLQSVIDWFSVHITPDEKAEVINDLGSIELQERVRQWHQDLWRLVRNDSRFEMAAHNTPPEFGEDDRSAGFDIFLASNLLSKQRDIPLLADERLSQMLALNENRGYVHAAFGTDALVVALGRAKLLSDDEVAGHLVGLMIKRYRFIAPSSSVLMNLASRYTHPPGEHLRAVALYAHDCMRDAGLFTGLEPTIPPTSIAWRLWHTWSLNIAEFIADAWLQMPEDKAETLTKWALSEFLPAPPVVLGPWPRAVAAQLEPRSTLVNAMLRSVTMQDQKKANSMIRSIARGLGLDPDGEDYLRMIAEVIDGV